MCGPRAKRLRSRQGKVVIVAPVDDSVMMQDAGMALVVKGQLTGNAVEAFNRLATVGCLKILK